MRARVDHLIIKAHSRLTARPYFRLWNLSRFLQSVTPLNLIALLKLKVESNHRFAAMEFNKIMR
jgi:hypothetical protein